jgi:hypothetical protein
VTISADDPWLWGALPWKCYSTPTRTIRYALGAQELCYPNAYVFIQEKVTIAFEMQRIKQGKWRRWLALTYYTLLCCEM